MGERIGKGEERKGGGLKSQELIRLATHHGFAKCF